MNFRPTTLDTETSSAQEPVRNVRDCLSLPKIIFNVTLLFTYYKIN